MAVDEWNASRSPAPSSTTDAASGTPGGNAPSPQSALPFRLLPNRNKMPFVMIATRFSGAKRFCRTKNPRAR
eukprot:31281-Prorocentrum_minimum.AAC.1